MPSTKLIAVLLGGLLLAGCNTTLRVATKPTEFGQVAVPQAAPVTMQRFRWRVLNASDLSKLAAPNMQNKDFVIIALTPDGYKALSNNMLELQRYIREQQNVILYLRETIDSRARPQ